MAAAHNVVQGAARPTNDANGVDFGDLPVEAGETATFTFYTNESVGADANGVPLEVILLVRGTGDLT